MFSQMGKSLFFPDGESPLGSANDFDFEVRDYSEQPLKSEETVGEMYSRTKMNILRFYLTTTQKQHEQDIDALPELKTPKKRKHIQRNVELRTEDKDDSDEQPQKTIQRNVEPRTENEDDSDEQPHKHKQRNVEPRTENEDDSDEQPHKHKQRNVEPRTENDDSDEQPQISESAGLANDGDILQHALEEANVDLNSDDEKNDLTDKFLSDLQNIDTLNKLDDSETEVFFKTISNNADEIPSVEMTVHRGPRSFQEVLSYFKDSTILKKIVSVVRILPNGEKENAEDSGGVFRDLLTEFWSDFYERCTLGRDAKVPALRHDFGQEEWESVCRIMIYGYKMFGYWPIKIAKSFLIKCMFPNAMDDKEMLLDDFFDFVSIQEKSVLQAAIENFQEVDFDEVLDALDTYHCRTRVTRENIKSILIEISHKELIQETSYISDCWREIMHVSSNISFNAIHETYGTLKPTNKKVIHMLQFPEVMNEQKLEVSKHLKRFIRELDPKNLALFLRFCTGSDMLITKTISVELSKMEGLQRRPIAHTCGCLLQLADQFENFMEFRNEFNNVLSSNVWVMDII